LSDGNIAYLFLTSVAIRDEACLAPATHVGLTATTSPLIDLELIRELARSIDDGGAQRHRCTFVIMIVVSSRCIFNRLGKSPIEPGNQHSIVTLSDHRDEAMLGFGAVAMRGERRRPTPASIGRSHQADVVAFRILDVISLEPKRDPIAVIQHGQRRRICPIHEPVFSLGN
jgi:hypothetical protein